jgi:hypothetical protein
LTEDPRTPGEIANENTDRLIASWKRNRQERRDAFALRFLLILGALACFAYAWSVNPY